MHCCSLALLSSILLFCLVASKSEKLCRDVTAGSQVVIKCVSDEGIGTFTNGSNIIWKTKIDTDQQRHEDWMSIFPSNETIIHDCRNSNLKDCRQENVLSVLYLRDYKNQNDVVAMFSCFTEDDVEIDGDRLATECPLPVSLARHGCLYHVVIEKFSCCWEWTADIPIPVHTDFTMTTIHLGDDETPVKTQVSCNISDNICCDTAHGNYFFKHSVSLSATIGNITMKSATSTVIPSNHIKASTLNITKAVPTKIRDRIGIYLEWKGPDDDVHMTDYDFKVRYRTNDVVSSWKKEDVIPNDNRFTIDDSYLQPNSIYAIQVKARARGLVVAGVWSKWSKSKLVRTSLKAPEKRLRFVTPLVTKVMLPNGTVHSTVKLIWSKYDNTMEEGFVTEISCTDPIREFPDITDETSVLLHTTSKDIHCNGKFCNKEGCSGRSQIDYNIEAETNYFPKPVKKVSLNSSVLQIIKESRSINDQVLRMRICSRSRSVTSATLPNDPQSPCLIRGFVYNDEVPLNASNTQVEIKGKWSPCLQYVVILENYARNNFVWKSAASYIVQYDPSIQEDVDFTLADSSTHTKAKITVTWISIAINEFMSRQLLYKPVGGSECDDDRKQACNSTFFHKIGLRNLTTVTLMNNVFGSTEYEVEEWLVCREDLSKRDEGQHQPFAVQVPVYGKVIETAITKPSKPRKLSISPLNSPNPIMSWTPPSHKNGFPIYEIVKYDINEEVKSRSRTDQNQQTVDISCGEPNDTFAFVVTAINESPEESLRSDDATLEKVPCIVAAGEYDSPNVTVTIVMVILITLVVMCIIILYCCRATIKKRLKNRFSAPSPKIDKLITDDGDVQYIAEKYKDVESEFYSSVVTVPTQNDEISAAVELYENNISNESVPHPNSSQAQGILSDQSLGDNTNLSDYIIDHSVESNDGYFGMKKKTISTALTVPAYTSCDSGIKQYVKVVRSPLENQCQDLERSHNEIDTNTTSRDSEYLADINLAGTGNVVYTDVQQPPSYDAEVPGEENDRYLDSGVSNTMNSESCPDDDLRYTQHCSETSSQQVDVSSKYNRASFNRQSSSSSGIIEDINVIEDSLKEEMTNFLIACVPSVILPESHIDVVGAEARSNCRKYEMEDIENANSSDDTSQEGYVDLERATLLSNDT